MHSVYLLGRQPALGLAELESLYGPAPLRVVKGPGSEPVAVVADAEPVDFRRLGGSIKHGKLLTILDTTSWKSIEKHLLDAAPHHAETLPEGKLIVGISVYGLPKVTTQNILATGLSIKKAVKKTGRPVRLVPNTELELNSASVLHNNLTGPNGWELLLIRDGDKTILAQTLAVQDIESYTLRDRGRPKRDPRVGMLPPKLAQIIINLATGATQPNKDIWILDPFCGTGVILQEAMLMGFSAEGSDIEHRMGEYTNANLDWLWKEFPETEKVLRGWQVGDATSHQWMESEFVMKGQEVVDAKRVPMTIQTIASETYLGRPFTTLPSPEILAQTVSECNLIIKKFLRNVHPQLREGTRLCLAVPAWQTRPGQFKHLPLIDSLEEMGYNRIDFEHVRNEDLIYYRPDQIVARELLVLTRK